VLLVEFGFSSWALAIHYRWGSRRWVRSRHWGSFASLGFLMLLGFLSVLGFLSSWVSVVASLL
jgi:hypothetical protein